MKILNFGSLNIDYVYSVDHFVRSGETLAALQREVFAGGKGLNQSIAVARALEQTQEIEVFHAGKIGTSDGLFLKKLLVDSGINCDFIYSCDEPTGHAIIQVNSLGQNCILLYAGANANQKEEINEVFKHFDAGDFLIIQNEISLVDYIIKKAFELGMTIFFNPSPYDLSIKKLPLDCIHYFLLNEIEAADITGIDSKDAYILSDALISQFKQTKIVLTLGKDGVVYTDNTSTYRHGIYDVEVVDTTAAGDTFTGYFIASLAQEMSIEKALQNASIASSITVSRKGAAPSIPNISEVHAWL